MSDDRNDDDDEIAALLERVEAQADDVTRATVAELLDRVLAMHRGALETLVAAGRKGTEAFESALTNDGVASVLLLHGLHPIALRTRVETALADLEREMRGFDARLEIVDVAGDAVTLALHGGGAMRTRIRQRVEESLLAVAPDAEIAWREIDGEGIVPVDRLTRRAAAPAADGTEVCEMCGRVLGERHDHVIDIEKLSLACACEACAILFPHESASPRRRVPHRIESLPGFRLDAATWSALGVPVEIAFFTRHSRRDGVIARFPGAAGAMEAVTSADAWNALVAENPVVGSLGEDVESILVNRLDGANEVFRASIDVCFEVTGVLRKHWRGLGGGTAAREELRRYFDRLRGAPKAVACAS